MLATSPFSFIPSVLAESYPAAMTLPYWETHLGEPGPAAPSRCMPRGKTQRFVRRSSLQSIERPVITVPSVPTYKARVHTGSPSFSCCCNAHSLVSPQPKKQDSLNELKREMKT